MLYHWRWAADQIWLNTIYRWLVSYDPYCFPSDYTGGLTQSEKNCIYIGFIYQARIALKFFKILKQECIRLLLKMYSYTLKCQL